MQHPFILQCCLPSLTFLDQTTPAPTQPSPSNPCSPWSPFQHSSFTSLFVLTPAKGCVQMSCRLSFAPHSPELKNCCFFPEEISESRESYMVVFFSAKPSTLYKISLNKIPFFTWFLQHLCIIWDLTSKIRGPCGCFVQLTQIPSVISLNYVVSHPPRQLKIPSVAFQSLTSVLRQHIFFFSLNK